MAQGSYVPNIAHDKAQALAFFNAVFEAIATNNSGATAPTETFPGMFWLDTSTTPPALRQRNQANSGWAEVVPSSDDPNFAVDADQFAKRGAIKTFVDAADAAFRDANALGSGQTWQNVNASRSDNTIYQNTTARPILVHIPRSSSGGTAGLQVSVNNSTWLQVATSRSSSGGGSPLTAIVPANWYYRCTASSEGWMELR